MTTELGPQVTSDGSAALAAIRRRLVGRDAEVELVLAAVETGRDVVLEGGPGTSKTTLLRAITESWGVPLVLVEGNAELTPGRLIGHHDPSLVLQRGYSDDTFDPGPLVRAMRSGAFLHFEELNRAPEDTLNALLTAIADREITVPRVGTVTAAPSFRLVASMNPYDNVGTTRLSVSIRDRLCRVAIGYQSAEEEQQIVLLRSDADAADAAAATLARDAVGITRLTREHPAVRQGSSVRGAIDVFLLARRLAELRGEETASRPLLLQAVQVGLSGRLLVDEGAGLTASEVLADVCASWFGADASSLEPG